MAYESVKVRDVVERAVGHIWSIPEFQRGFVWKATQVRDLMESLWLDYPIGSMLVWDSKPDDYAQERNVADRELARDPLLDYRFDVDTYISTGTQGS